MEPNLYTDRKTLMEMLGTEFGFKPMLYVTGDRPSAGQVPVQASIEEDVLPLFLDHLDHIGNFGKVDHLGLIIYSRGGNIIAGWSIINLLRQFCNKLTIIVPYRAQSTATLMCLGADEIIMTKQAILGPIDPSTNSPFNPIPSGYNTRVPLNVENFAAYIEMAKSIEITQQGMTEIFLKLSECVNPVAIGTVFRTRNQIRTLADKLMCLHNQISEEKRKLIVQKLCEDAGSHDYTIHRREASELGLNIRKPNDNQYKIIKAIHDDFSSELELNVAFSPQMPSPPAVTTLTTKQAVLESVDRGSHTFVTEWKFSPHPAGGGQVIIEQLFQGWR